MLALFFFIIAQTTPRDLFQQGNTAYEAGRFGEAVDLYTRALADVRAAELFYNRGNAYFKQGELGRALADYLRGYALKPNDPDIKNNIAFVRQFRPDKNTTPASPFLAALRAGFVVLPAAVTRLVLGGCFFLLALVLALYFITNKKVFGFVSSGLALVFLYFLVAALFWQALTAPNQAVVVVPEAIVRSGPGPEYKEIAAVHDGLEVRIIEEGRGYRLIQLPGGVGGWVEAAAVERIFAANP